MKFLRNLLASVLGFFIALAILFFIFMIIGTLMSADKEIAIKSNSILEIDLKVPIKDYAPKSDDPFEKLIELDDEYLALNKIINAIDNAKTDDRIKGISIKTSAIQAGVAQTQAIRNKLREFKDSGKFIFAYNDVYNQKNYYLSSVADSLFLNPVGAIELGGLSTEVLYFKDFEDRYGIKMEVIRHGKYKSAVEPFLSNKMSEANREQISSFLNSMWATIKSDIGKSRGISLDKIDSIANQSLSRNPQLAKAHQLIDNSIYEDEYETKLKRASDTNFDDKLNVISLQDYINSGKGYVRSTAKNKIAVIYAQGDIIYGKGNENVIGQEMLNQAIDKAVRNKKVKAIVLRVNSPGGSALASELIWRKLSLAKKEKPLVVSMGNLAASGGYYISCLADKIYAEPTTITGSIGVFGAIPNVHRFADNIGINAEQVHTNNGASYSIFEPMNDTFYTVTKEGVETIYNTFVNRVARGRNMTFEQVNNIAQGRVWSGAEAKQKGLVDELGGLQDAIAAAARLAEIEEYRIKNYPNYKKDFKDVFESIPLIKVDKNAIIKEHLGDENFKLYNQLNKMKNLQGIQARMPFDIFIK